MFSPIVMTRPKQKKPSVTLLWFCFLFVYFRDVLFFLYITLLKQNYALSIELFQRKFAINSVIKFYRKMWNSRCMQTIIIFIFYELPSKANSNQKPTFFLERTTLFLLSLLLCGSRFLKREDQFFGF